MNKNNIKGPAAVILAGVLWGIINIFIRGMSAYGLDSPQIVFVRMSLSAIIFVAYVAIRFPEKLKIRLRDAWIFLGTGIVSNVFFNVCLFYAMVNGPVSVAVVLLYTAPVFIMLFSAIFFKEKITLQKIIALVLTVLGCVLTAGIIGGSMQVSFIVLLAGILSGLFYSLYTIFSRVGLKKYDTETVTAWTFIFATIGVAPLGKIGQTITTIRGNPVLILWSLGIAVVCTILPLFLYTWGLNHMESGKASILVAVEPLVGTVIGMTLFGESHEALKIIGIVLLLAAIVLMNLQFKAKNNN